jgi:opacity protein-like surface antigen
MKKLLLSAAIAVLAIANVNAQDGGGQTSKGKWLIEANTGFSSSMGEGLYQHTANTGFGLTSIDGTTVWSIGAEGGYFVIDDLAIKAGLGYTDYDGNSLFSYKLGAKYYIISKIPVQIDLNGTSSDSFGDENPLWLGLQGGYAFFLGPNVSVEPGLRYSHSLNEDFTDEGIFQLRIGFALHF